MRKDDGYEALASLKPQTPPGDDPAQPDKRQLRFQSPTQDAISLEEAERGQAWTEPGVVAMPESVVRPSETKESAADKKPTRIDTLFSNTAMNAVRQKKSKTGSRKGGDAASVATTSGGPRRSIRNHWLYVLLTNMTGFMPKFQSRMRKHLVTHFFDALLRGVGQIVFCENPISGLFIIVALLWESPWLAMTSVIGIISSTSTALLLNLDQASIDAGLQGFNSFLVGGAVATFVEHSWQAAVIVIPLCACVCIVHNAMRRVFEVFEVPAFTLPFIIVSLIFFLATFGLPNFETSFNAPQLIVTTDVAPLELSTYLNAAPMLQSFASGVAQIFFCAGWRSGVWILAGMLICSPILAVFCFIGSVVGTLTGIICGASATSLTFGLWGYNGALGAIATVAFYVPTYTCMVYAVFCAFFCTLCGAAFSSLFTPHGIPSLTLGFVFGTCNFMLIAGMTPLLVHVRELWKDGKEVWEAGGFSPPEKHLKMFRTQAKPISPLLSILTGLHPAVLMYQVGARRTKLPKRMLTRLLRSTSYSDKELNERFQTFIETFPRGVVYPGDFEKFYQKMFPLGDAHDFADLLFKRFDSDGDGCITFEEYMQTMSLIAHGTLEDRLSWIFTIYGGDLEGDVTRDDIVHVLHAVYKLLEDSGVLLPEQPIAYAENFFRKATEDDMMAESFRLDAFLNALVDDEELMTSLKVYDKI